MSRRGRPPAAVKTETVRVARPLADTLHEIARLEGSTVAKVAERLFRQAAESELKRARERAIKSWAASAK